MGATYQQEYERGKRQFVDNVRSRVSNMCGKNCRHFGTTVDMLVSRTVVDDLVRNNVVASQSMLASTIANSLACCGTCNLRRNLHTVTIGEMSRFLTLLAAAAKIDAQGQGKKKPTNKGDDGPRMIQPPQPKSDLLCSTREAQLAELGRNRYVRETLKSGASGSQFVNLEDVGRILSLFDLSVDVPELRGIFETKDTSRLEHVKMNAKLLVAAATINGNEHDAEKYGQLMGLVEARFGKKPPRRKEDDFMREVATALLAKLEGRTSMCVGEEYISTWASRQLPSL